MRQSTLLVLSLASTVGALDLEFDSIQCDTKLPAYVQDNGVTMSCKGNERCTFGESATISGKIIYNGLQDYNLDNTTGYVSGNLQLMTLDYNLFDYLPFNFCGNWIMNAAYSYQNCPADGTYHFDIPYQLPEGQGLSTWFATGWEGVSYLKIYRSQSAKSALLAHCKLHFKTYVTNAGTDHWRTLPSAATTTIILFSVLGVLFMTVLCLACRKKKTYPTDAEYDTDFKAMAEDKILAERDEESTEEEVEASYEEKARNISMRMNYV